MTKRYRRRHRAKVKAYRSAYYRRNREKIEAARRTVPLARKLWNNAKFRARRIRARFEITVEDVVVPDRCPVFGTKFEAGTPRAASLDRIVPSLGYVPGNVVVISHRANVMKSDATAAEVRRLADWLAGLDVPRGAV